VSCRHKCREHDNHCAPGQTVKIRAIVKTQETPEGDLIGYQFELQTPCRDHDHDRPRRRKQARDHTETNGKTNQKEIPWDATIKARYQDRLLKDDP